MKAMIWKELRENFKWAVLALIGLGLAEVYGLYYVPENSEGTGQGMGNPPFLMATTFGCALVGLALGFLQILPEQRRDQWAALLHRPVTRGVILRGKLAAGLLLYLFATLPPFLACIWLNATPGHFIMPFVPGLTLAGLSDLCLGLVYYLAAVLSALQRGSWLGARTLVLLAAAQVSFFINADFRYFNTALLAIAAMALLLLVATFGAMHSNGLFRVRPWITRIALLAAVFYGLWGAEAVVSKMLRPGGNNSEFQFGSRYEFTKEGQPLIITTNKDLTTRVTDLAGKPVLDPRYQGQMAYQNSLALSQVTYAIGDLHGVDLSKRYYNYRSTSPYINGLQRNSSLPLPNRWFYLPQRGYFIGISRLNKLPVGLADRTGFIPPTAIPVPFQVGERLQWGVYSEPSLVNEGRDAVLLDFDHSSLLSIPSPNGDTSYGAGLPSFETSVPGVEQQAIALALTHELRIYDLFGKPLAVLPYHEDVKRFGTVSIGKSPWQDRYYIHYSASFWIDWAERHLMPSYFEEVDAQGNILHSYFLPAFPEDPVPRTWADYFTDSVQAPAFWYGTVACQSIGTALGIPHYQDRSYNAHYPERSHPAWLGQRILLISLLLVPVALFWAQHGRLSRRSAIVWALLTLAFNIGGLLAYRLVIDWPVQVPCPACGRRRPTETDSCPHCGAAWPDETPKGIEIFDHENASAEAVT